MVQAEVAERIAAEPGEMSSLAVAVQAQARVQIVRRVPAAAFYPRPKVDSAVLLVEPMAEGDRAISRAELPEFVTLVQAGFKQPRKKLVNSLAEGLGIPKPQAADRLARAGIEAGQRPQDLSLAEWVHLFRTP
jgi:16S rRNA (adenine1518-N6/adenine1519-N6)-dimethyltransferase